MELDLRSPDHTTLSRRGQHLALTLRGVPRRAGFHLIIDSTGLSMVGQGEWAAAKHGGRGTRGWRKLHVGVDQTGVIVAHALTDATGDDATTGVELIEAVNDDITRVTADAAYDTVAFYDAAGSGAQPSWFRRPRRRSQGETKPQATDQQPRMAVVRQFPHGEVGEGLFRPRGPGRHQPLTINFDSVVSGVERQGHPHPVGRGRRGQQFAAPHGQIGSPCFYSRARFRDKAIRCRRRSTSSTSTRR